MNGPLTVADLISLKLSQCRLAFLSACHTVDNQADNLLDEGLRLGGACQLAGFPHVIGTLWQVQDLYVVKIVRNVYERMSGGFCEFCGVCTSRGSEFTRGVTAYSRNFDTNRR